MRILWLCLVPTAIAAAAAAVVLAPEADEVGDRPASQFAGLPPVDAEARRWLPAAGAEPEPPTGAPVPAEVAEPPIGDEWPPSARAELDRLREELVLARTESSRSRLLIADLVRDHCVRRFSAELDEWLDGPLAWVHQGDAFLRRQLYETLESAAWALGRHDAWDPETQQSYDVRCPESMDVIRVRYPAGTVAQLAESFRGWRADATREPRLTIQSSCGYPSGAVVTCGSHEAKLPLDDPQVKSLRAEQQRFERSWKQRINALLGVAVYKLD